MTEQTITLEDAWILVECWGAPHCVLEPRRVKHSPNCPGARYSPCAKCKMPMQWAVTENEKGIPLDAYMVENGNLIFVRQHADGRPVVRYASAKDPVISTLAPRYRSHFASCPAADEFRKKKR